MNQKGESAASPKAPRPRRRQYRHGVPEDYDWQHRRFWPEASWQGVLGFVAAVAGLSIAMVDGPWATGRTIAVVVLLVASLALGYWARWAARDARIAGRRRHHGHAKGEPEHTSRDS